MMISERAAKAREYSRKRWRLFARQGQLKMVQAILRQYQSGETKEVADNAIDWVSSLEGFLRLELEKLNSRQREELRDED